jgi:hydrogenase nickel incorporation protein HypA/HybF
MHEWGLTRALVREIARAAAREGEEKVLGVKVKIGALSGISPARLREQFVIVAAGSVAEGAALEVEISDDVFAPQSDSVVLETLEFEG